MLLPLRPLVPVSALALLGWCWFAFRKRRNRANTIRTHSLEEIFEEQDVADNTSTLKTHDLEVDCPNQSEDSSSPSPYTNKSLNSDCSYVSSPTNELSILHGTSHASTTTSNSVVRLRPEPEGEVSQVQELPPLVENPEMDTTFKDHPDFKVDETGPTEKQPTGTNLSENHSDKAIKPKAVEVVNTSLDFEIMDVATEEILTAGGVFLKEKSQMVPKETLQSNLQHDLNKDPILLVCNFTKTVAESDALSPKCSLSEQCQSPSASQTGEDSGCCSSYSEDGGETQELHHSSSGMNEQLSPEKEDGTNVTVANGVRCVNEERTIISHAARPHRANTEFWDVEVPAHLVGRLIGKNGKHIDFLKKNSGATIYVSALAYTHEVQICHIEGSKVQVENALTLIRKKFKDLDLSNRHASLQPAALPPAPITYWLLLPQDRTVEVIVTRVEAANCLFVQQHTHPTHYALCCLNEQMVFCYSHPGCPSLPTPVEAGVLCAAPSADGGWWRAQVIHHHKDSNTVQIRYVDYGGYVTLDLGALRQIRSDFMTLPFQATEVMLENIAPVPGKAGFSAEAKQALEELTQGVPLIIKVTGSQNGLPLVHMWRSAGEEMISVNGTLVDRGLCSWLNSH